ncbi:MAG: glycosyltransferase [Nitrospira sp.]|nr:glycosyltransferase [Nitrospira sp.]
MRILYVAMKYDYGRRNQGPSFEHYNFYDCLRQMGHDIVYFDFMTLMQEHGRSWMNTRLMEVAKLEKPDLMFTVLFTDEFDAPVLRGVTEDLGVISVNWFCDDHWRFERYSRLWAPCFQWVVTTAESALPKYAQIGYRNVIKSQWACNTFLYRRMNLPLEYDVTFVGQPYGQRRKVIEQLRHAGITVSTWGQGWDEGRASQDEMIKIFNTSRINLNLTASYGANADGVQEAASRKKHPLRRLLERIPLATAWRGGTIGCEQSSPASEPDHPTVRERAGDSTEQIKGRNFEVPGTGGFLLTQHAAHLEDYYEPGREVVSFHSTEEMIEKVHYYLAHDAERTAIAEAGYQRTLSNHTYQQRFNDIFSQIGLGEQTASAQGDKPFVAGQTQEVR